MKNLSSVKHPPKPDFICIGMQKSGTNWLYDQLNSHPSFTLPPVKELHFFDRGFNFERAYPKFETTVKRAIAQDKVTQADFEFFRRALLTPSARRQERAQIDFTSDRKNSIGKIEKFAPDETSLKWYGELFRFVTADQLTGDITPAYSTLDENEVRQVFESFPDTKILLGIRRPVERVWSQICQGLRRGDTFSSDDAVDPDQVYKLIMGNERFVERSFPSRIFERWEKFYGSKVHPYFFEDLVENPVSLRGELLGIFGLEDQEESFTLAAESDRKSGNKRLEMPSAVRDRLESLFEKEIDSLKARFPQARRHW